MSAMDAKSKPSLKAILLFVVAVGSISLMILFPPPKIERPGCTDVEMYNYDPKANVDDGSCTEKIFGCTWFRAQNYDPKANTMLDNSCLVIRKIKCPVETKKVRVDLKRFPNVQMSFIHLCDETTSDAVKLIDGKRYREQTIMTRDTLSYNSRTDGLYANVPVTTGTGVQTKVIEIIPGFESREFLIDIRGYVRDCYLLNPREHNTYEVHKHVYGGKDYIEHEPEVTYHSGSVIYTGPGIDYWFEEAPEKIEVTTYRDRPTLQNVFGYERYQILRQ